MKPALILTLALGAATAQAGPGHDHGDAPVTSATGAPQRLPDGSVFMPKPAQRQLGLRTEPTVSAALPRSLILQGQVVADPNAGGLVQPTQAGRLVAPGEGLPGLGQRVQRGQLLAWLEPAASALERSAQVAQVAELTAQLSAAEQRGQRLQELSDTVPRREIEAAASEVQGLRGRIAALGGGLSAREALRAPVSGVIAAASAVAGQVVDAREAVFEIVDPARLRIEALAFDAAVAADIGAAFLEQGSTPQPLRLLGAGARLRGQALPINFALQASTPLAVGQPVRVVVHSRSTVTGWAVPAASLMKNPANQTIVWVKRAPEQFEPRVVQVQPLDGLRVSVTQGLADGDRVVTSGATLLNQVR